MCGICGIVSSDGQTPDSGLLRRMASTMRHRGPDDEGYAAYPGAGLGFRRLSIIDPAGSRQPVANEDGSVSMVCNGEIYNYLELRRDLEQRGHTFRTDGDAETVVHAYEEWGRDCLLRLRGMFSLALWDSKESCLLLARDRFGIKPLLYSCTGGRLVFGSELKAVLASGLVEDDIDWRGIDVYLSLMYIPAPLTAYRAIRKLPPAHCLEYRGGAARVSRYWDPPREAACAGFAESVERLHALLEESVKLHLQSDVPVAFFLSGGMDSSALVALAAGAASAPVTTFSVGFTARSHDELPYARQVAQVFGCDHHEQVVRPDAAAVLPRIVSLFDEPFGDSSAVPTYYVCRAAAGSVKVVLGGDGGDELLAGYEWTRRQRLMERWLRVPGGIRAATGCMFRGREETRGAIGKLSRFLGDARAAPLDGYLRRVSCFTPGMKRACYGPVLAPLLGRDAARELMAVCFDVPGRDVAAAMSMADLAHYLPGDDLRKVDGMTMLHSLEGRVPLLDHVVAEFLLGLPFGFRLKGATSKYILREAMRDVLPAAILARRKQGFGVPVARWMAADLRDDARRLLVGGRAETRGLLKPGAAAAMLDRHRAGRADHGHRIWCLLVLELWLRLCVDSRAGTLSDGTRLSDV